MPSCRRSPRPSHEGTIMTGYDKLIFELSSPGRVGYPLPAPDVPNADPKELLPAKHLRASPPELPEVSELDVVRHYSRLSQLNYGVDTHFYPLGSCTMKYNPKLNEDMARLGGFARLHPLTPERHFQGALQLMWELGRDLAEIAGMDAVSLQPAAGAHDHGAEHPRALRAADPRDQRDVPRQGRAGVHGRRQPERDPRDHAPRRLGLRRLPLQPPQDVHDAPRRRGPRGRARGREGASRAVPP